MEYFGPSLHSDVMDGLANMNQNEVGGRRDAMTKRPEGVRASTRGGKGEEAKKG